MPGRVAKAFADAVGTGNVGAISATLSSLDRVGAWRPRLKAVSRLPCVLPAVRDWFLGVWVEHGDHIRSEVNDDLILFDGLRALLPIYDGPALKLYRGDSAYNRRCRSYGPSWTIHRDVADGFACGWWRTFQGGSVVLETIAPPEAILCAPHLLGDEGMDEGEFIVDRRRLCTVCVVQRYDQVGADRVPTVAGALRI